MLVGGAAWTQQGRLRALLVEPPPSELPDIPAPSASPEAGRSVDRYATIHQKFGPPPAAPKASGPDRTPFSIAGGFARSGGSVRVMLRNSEKRARVYRVGDLVDVDKGEVLAIDVERETVQTRWAGREWTLTWDRSTKPAGGPSGPFPHGSPAPPPRPPASGDAEQYEMTGAQFADYQAHFMDKYWQQGNYQVLAGGGIRITRLEPDAEVRKYGFRENDVVLALNGTRMEGLARITQLFGEMSSKGVEEHVLEIERDGKPRQIRIRVKS